MQHNKP